jgi:hypothetical protein
MLGYLWPVIIFYSALVLLILRKWGTKGFGVSFVATLVIMVLISLLWNIVRGGSLISPPLGLAIQLIVFVFMLFMGSGTALLFHWVEDNETERRYTLMISGLSAFFGGVSLLPAMTLFVILDCFILNECI